MLLQASFNPLLLIIEFDDVTERIFKRKSKIKAIFSVGWILRNIYEYPSIFLKFHIQFSLIHIYSNLTRKKCETCKRKKIF